MHRPRKFFTLILILLIINALFFIGWYAVGGRDWVRTKLTTMVGNMIDAEISLGDLHISDKQIFAQDLHFATSDSLISLSVENIRVRYNLYKFLFSGFKPMGVVGSIEIVKPKATVSYHMQTPKKKSSSKSGFSIPDLKGYFRTISLVDGSISADAVIPLRIMNAGELYIEESLKNINLTIDNSSITDISLTANTYNGGRISVNGRLDTGRIELAEADIADYRPLYISHPDIRDFRTEININAAYKEPADSSQAQYSGKALIWDTTALVLDEHRLSVPLISAEARDNNLDLRITRSQIGSSDLDATIFLRDLGRQMSFDGSALRANLDLSMINPRLSGMLSAVAQASGSIKDPLLTLDANTAQIAYDQWALSDLVLSASYQDDIARVEIPHGSFENQALKLSASFDPRLMGLEAELNTWPVSTEAAEYYAEGTILLQGNILRPYPMLEARVQNLNLAYQQARLDSVNGLARMVPLEHALLVDAELNAGEDIRLLLNGDILSQHLLLDAHVNNLDVAKAYPMEIFDRFQPHMDANISAMMLGRKIWTSSDLGLRMDEEYPIDARFSILGSGDIKDLSATAFIRTEDSRFNDHPLDLQLSANYAQNQLHVFGLRINDLINLSGRVNLKDYQDMDFDLGIKNLATRDLSAYYPDLALMVPEFRDLSLFANYNRAQDRKLSAWLNLRHVDLLSIIPVDLDLRLAGMPEDLEINGGIRAHGRELLTLEGTANLLPRVNLALSAHMQDLKMQEVLTQSPGEGKFSGSAGLRLMDLMAEEPGIEFFADLSADAMKFGDFSINHARVKAEQSSQALTVDSLYVVSEDLFTATAKGALGFNVIKNEYFATDNTMEVSIRGQLFPWLEELTDYVLISRGASNLRLSIGNDEEQFVVKNGELDIHDGYVLLKDQVEALRNIEFKGMFEDNRFILQRGQFSMGNGRFYMNNVFDPEPTDHFMVGFIDLGYLRLNIEQPGIQATIPMVAPPKTLSNISLKGQNSRYATIRGPFDDMKIEAHVTASNLDILFPPGADNLLNLILSVRSSGKKPDTDPVPLPFQMDLFVSIGENVRYVTYPTNLNLQPGGFLHLLYDGSQFIVKEVFINSERGSVDFFGTVFEVDNIAISMIEQQDIMNVEGLFYKRTPDGSTVSLTVKSTPDFEKSLLDRLDISLTSDNPADRNITQVLSRLRYNQSMDELPDEQKQNLLQDEALGLIGGNLNSTVLTPFLYPVENWVRRNLGLDSFSINAGFIQNIFTEYSSDPSELADMADLSNLGSDISRFSSSILLNNLSVSMSKYLGYRFFVDYEFGLQEATDLQKKTRIMVSHDTSLRLVLPKNYRIGYTFRYEPNELGITHEIMIQRTLRFWGL